MGERIGVSIDSLGLVVAGTLISFIASWQLSLAMLALAPLLAGSGAIWAIVR